MPIDIDKILELERMAQSAPWSENGFDIVALKERTIFGGISIVIGNPDYFREDDQKLILALRNSAKEMCEELRALREENAKIKRISTGIVAFTNEGENIKTYPEGNSIAIKSS